jgi:hypothetical protein
VKDLAGFDDRVLARIDPVVQRDGGRRLVDELLPESQPPPSD